MFPTHHVADLFINVDVRKTASAAGLNMCFLLYAKINFEDMARTETQKTKNKSGKVFGGVTIKARINAVMKKDSVFV